jgi:formylglycine-generating enzyme required for sulfatase activity
MIGRKWFLNWRIVAVALVVMVAAVVLVGRQLVNSETEQALRPAQPTIQTGGHSCAPSPGAGRWCVIGGVEVVAIPGGEFAMGDDSYLASPNEQPVHRAR